jgi:hypothetical protein
MVRGSSVAQTNVTANKRAHSAKLTALGKDGVKRTPKHIADLASKNGQEKLYEVESIVGTATRFGKEVYEVKWKGYGSADNTYEPITNLPGYEGLIAEFNVRYKEQQRAEALAAAANADDDEAPGTSKRKRGRTSTGKEKKDKQAAKGTQRLYWAKASH